jgi:GGDEF domain-containing protein
MIEVRDMPARLNRALQVRTADRLQSSLARDQISGLPVVGALSDDDQRELREVGGGRIAAIVFRVEWVIDAARHPRAMHEVQSLVMSEVARLIDVQVRRTDLLGSLSEDALVILAPALDPMSAQSLGERLRELFAGRQLELGGVQVQVRVKVGVASRSAASPAGWTTQTLAQEAERNASDLPPIAIVARAM